LPAIVAALAALVAVVPGVAFADMLPALPWSATWDERIYQPGFDYDTDGCYPVAAIGANGQINPGLRLGGAVNGHCHDAEDLDNVNVYSRRRCNNGWCAYMYQAYFEKDQTLDGCAKGPACGHTHDWEGVIVWEHDGWGQYVSVSRHTGYETKARNDTRWDGTGKHAMVVYHKDGPGTHCFRLASDNDVRYPENHKHQMQWPPLVGWDNWPSGLRDKLTSTSFGSATFKLKDGLFEAELAKAKPTDVPLDPNG